MDKATKRWLEKTIKIEKESEKEIRLDNLFSYMFNMLLGFVFYKLILTLVIMLAISLLGELKLVESHNFLAEIGVGYFFIYVFIFAFISFLFINRRQVYNQIAFKEIHLVLNNKIFSVKYLISAKKSLLQLIHSKCGFKKNVAYEELKKRLKEATPEQRLCFYQYMKKRGMDMETESVLREIMFDCLNTNDIYVHERIIKTEENVIKNVNKEMIND